MIGGLPFGVWWGVWSTCYKTDYTSNGRGVMLSVTRQEWPDGEPMLEQESLLSQMFSLIADEYMRRVNGKHT